MSLKIPASERQHVAAFVSASPELLNAFQQAIATCSPTLMQSDLASALSEKLHGVPGYTAATVASILRTLLAIYSMRDSEDRSSAVLVAGELVEAAKKDKLGPPNDGWDAFQALLTELVSDNRVIGVSAKAVSIATDTDRMVREVRVLTDARPIFGDNAKDGPKAFAIMHTLRIAYFQDGESRDWYVTLDGNDLESLQGAAERALSKERSTRAALQKTDLPVLSWKVNQNDE
jgi:hypothetical protein